MKLLYVLLYDKVKLRNKQGTFFGYISEWISAGKTKLKIIKSRKSIHMLFVACILCIFILFVTANFEGKYLCYEQLGKDGDVDQVVCTFNKEIIFVNPMVYLLLPYDSFQRPLHVFHSLRKFLCAFDVTCNYHDYMQLMVIMVSKVKQLIIPYFRVEHYYTLYLFHMNQLQKYIEQHKVGAYNNTFVAYTQTQLPLEMFRWTKETSVSIIISGNACFNYEDCKYNVNSHNMINLLEQLQDDLAELVNLAEVNLVYGYAFPHSDQEYFASNCNFIEYYFQISFPNQTRLVTHCYGRFLPPGYSDSYQHYDLREEIARYAYETFQSEFYILLDPTVTIFPPLWLAGMVQTLMLGGIQPGVGIGFTGCLQIQTHEELLREDPTLPTVYPIAPTLTKSHFELFFPLSGPTLSNPLFPEILNNLLFYDVYQSLDAVFCADRKYLKEYREVLLPMYHNNMEDYIDYLQLARYQILSLVKNPVMKTEFTMAHSSRRNNPNSLQPIYDWLQERMSYLQYQDIFQICYCHQLAHGCKQEFPHRATSGKIKLRILENVTLHSKAYGHIPKFIMGSHIDTMMKQALLETFSTIPIPICNEDKMSMYNSHDTTRNDTYFLQTISNTFLQSLKPSLDVQSNCTLIDAISSDNSTQTCLYNTITRDTNAIEGKLHPEDIDKLLHIVSNRTYELKQYYRTYPPWNMSRKKAHTKVAVITAIYGDYEISCKSFAQQSVAADFYCFTDQVDIRSNGWIVDTTPYHLDALRYEFDHSDPITGESLLHELNAFHNNQHPFNIAKYYKLNFHAIPVLQSYDIIIWIDGTIRITDPNAVKKVVDIIYEEEKDIVVFEHLRRGNVTVESLLSRHMHRYSHTEVRGYFQPSQQLTNQIEVYYGRTTPNISKEYKYTDEYWKELSYQEAYRQWEQSIQAQDPIRLIQLEHYWKVGICPALRTYLYPYYESEYAVQEMFGFDVNTIRTEYGMWCTCFIAFYMRTHKLTAAKKKTPENDNIVNDRYGPELVSKSSTPVRSKAATFLDLWSAHNRKHSTQDQISFPYVSQILQIHPLSLPYGNIYGSYVYNTLFVKTEHGLR